MRTYLLNFFSIKNLNMTSDIIWNLFSTVIIGAGGLFLSFSIALYYGTEQLGIFHQIFTFYLILSLLTTFGIQFSVTKYFSQYSDNADLLNKILTSALLIVLFLSIIISSITFFSAPTFSKLYGNSNITEGLMITAYALPFFGLNKVFSSVLNGLQMMKSYAIINSFRMLFLISGLLIMIQYDYNFINIFYVIIFGELIMFTFMIFYFHFILKLKLIFDNFWLFENLSFGSKSLVFSGTTELNDKLDIIAIGYLLSDREVGVYSLISLIVKGYLQIFGTVWIVFNPVATRLWSQNKYEELTKSVKMVINRSYKISFIIAIILGLVYPTLLGFTLGQGSFSEVLAPFYILLFGVFIFSGFESFKPILVSIGQPSVQSSIMLQVFILNLFLTFPLIVLYGLVGAAISAFMSYVFYSTLLVYNIRKFFPSFKIF